MLLEASRLEWHVISDAVMGGCSRGQVRSGPQGLRFSGTLSTRNNGGFSSIRSPLPRPVTNLCSVRLRLRGDGRRYQVRLRASDEPGAPAWRAYFQTDGLDQTLRFEWRDFEAVIRGRQVQTGPPLPDRAIRFIGIMLATAEAGPFALELEALELLSLGHSDD